MSNSRLEKFIYAICGMEVDDLPTPLSRIETLWNCLITGETPVFEPLSRNEKYLMSMLTGDVDALPEPASRSEKLLYKIATGETDLTDVPGYLSRYEELLKYLIENGGIGGTDFEYVLYTLNDSFSTLYSTAEAPVESAILKGQTLVNLLKVNKDNYIFNQPQNWSIEDEYFKCVSTTGWHTVTDRFNNMIKPSTKYLIVVEIKENTLNIDVRFDGYGTALNSSTTYLSFNSNEVGIKKVVITTPSTIDSTKNGLFRMPINVPNEGSILKFRVMAIEYQDGMENWDIPYFEGMQSVKMPVLTTTGKNLLNNDWERGGLSLANGTIQESSNEVRTKTFSKVTPITNYIVSMENFTFGQIYYYDKKYNFISRRQFGENNLRITTPDNCEYIKVQIVSATTDIKVQLEEGSQATPYEPYKSNILTVNEDVTLCGIGDVRDTLDCLTGEVTERIGEIVLDGSENWAMNMPTSEYSKPTIRVSCTKLIKGGYASNNKLISDKIPIRTGGYDYEIFGISALYDESLYIQIPRTLIGLDLEENTPTVVSQKFKEWFTTFGTVKVQYPLATESVKTVVLSTLDQDGQPTKLSTFNDITHVSIDAEDLLPTVDLEVATKIEETLSSLPTQMIDISETQQSLNEKIDEQAENINEVSTAMIEIRNDIL